MISKKNEIQIIDNLQKERLGSSSSKTLFKDKNEIKPKHNTQNIKSNMSSERSRKGYNFLSRIKLQNNLLKQNSSIQLLLYDYKETFENDSINLQENLPFTKELKALNNKISSKTIIGDSNFNKNKNNMTNQKTSKFGEESFSNQDLDKPKHLMNKLSFNGLNDNNYQKKISFMNSSINNNRSHRKIKTKITHENQDNDNIMIEYNEFPKILKKSIEEESIRNTNHDKSCEMNNLKEEIDLFSSSKDIYKSAEKSIVEDNQSFDEFRKVGVKYDINTRDFIKLNNVYDSLSFSEEVNEEIYSSILIDPHGNFKIFWDILMIIIIIYSIIVTPYLICFLEIRDKTEVVLEFIVDIIFIIDFVLNFFTPFYDKEENLITNVSHIFMNYLENSFFSDLFTSIPYSIIDYIFNSNNLINYNNNHRSIRFFVCLQWIRVFRIYNLKIPNSNIYLTELNNFNETRINRMLRFIFYFILVIHVTSCLWIFIGRINFDNENWIGANGLEKFNKYDIYIASVYFNLVTIYTIGYGDITAANIIERIYLCFFMFIGILLYSLTVSNFSTFLTITDKRIIDYENKIEILDMIDKDHEINKVLYKKIKRYLKICYNNSYDERYNLLESLPNKIKNDLTIFMYKNHIKELNFFKQQPHDLILYVLPLLKTHNIKRGDTLFSVGEYIEDMYLVIRGSLVLTLSDQLDNIEIYEIRANYHFGEIFLETHEQSPYELKCKSKKTEMLVLKKKDYLSVKNVFRENIIEILKKSYNTLERIDKKKKVILELLKIDDNPKNVKQFMKNINREMRMDDLDFNNDFDSNNKSDDEINFLVKNQEKYANLLKSKMENQRKLIKKQTQHERNIQSFHVMKTITEESDISPSRNSNYNFLSDRDREKSFRSLKNDKMEEKKQKDIESISNEEPNKYLNENKKCSSNFQELKTKNNKRKISNLNLKGLTSTEINENFKNSIFTLKPSENTKQNIASFNQSNDNSVNILDKKVIEENKEFKDVLDIKEHTNQSKRVKHRQNLTHDIKLKKRNPLYKGNSLLIAEILKNIDVDQKHLNLLYEQKDIQMKAISLLKRKSRKKRVKNKIDKDKNHIKESNCSIPNSPKIPDQTNDHLSDSKNFIIINNNFINKGHDQNINYFFPSQNTNNYISTEFFNSNSISQSTPTNVFIKKPLELTISKSNTFEIIKSRINVQCCCNKETYENSLKVDKTIELNIYVGEDIKRKSKCNRIQREKYASNSNHNSEKYLIKNRLIPSTSTRNISEKCLTIDKLGVNKIINNDSQKSLIISKFMKNNNIIKEKEIIIPKLKINDFISTIAKEKKEKNQEEINLIKLDHDLKKGILQYNNKLLDHISFKKKMKK